MNKLIITFVLFALMIWVWSSYFHAIPHLQQVGVLKNFQLKHLDDFSGELNVDGEYAILTIHDKDQVKPMFSYATYLMLIHGLMCWLTGQRIAILNMQLKCAAPQDDADYRVRFCDEIEYACTAHKIYFEALTSMLRCHIVFLSFLLSQIWRYQRMGYIQPMEQRVLCIKIKATIY